MASSKSKSAAADASAREKALATTLSSLNKRFGDGAIMKLGEATRLNVESIPTGSLSLDIALGVGGIPKGRIVEIYGPESSGKTTVCLHVIAEAQREGGICGFVDVEHALDPAYAAKIGVDIDNLLISASRTPASRRWRSPRCWCDPAPWTSS